MEILMKQLLSFDDVLIVPHFSKIKSRKDVDLSQYFCGLKLDLPIISSNMDTVTGVNMANAMREAGAVGALHRFMSIDENVKQFLETSTGTIVSIGLGKEELKRAEALHFSGANTILIDVAHGASMEVVNQVKQLREFFGYNLSIIVGNFATSQSIRDFNHHLRKDYVDAYKVGIGGGSACLTRVVTGCGAPTLASVLDCATVGVPIIADGGMRTSGDIAKALAAGATTVMLGGMLAGTDESPGEIVNKEGHPVDLITKCVKPTNDPRDWYYDNKLTLYKKYRGSASTESYEIQGKLASHRSYEGDSFLVPFKGHVGNVLQQIEGGLRSALSYVGASNMDEFREYAELIQITSAGTKENGSHGRNS
jgi:IMP dehydrogenase